jgi:hypothetical protein
MESIAKGGIGGLIVSILMMILKWKQGDAPSPELLTVAGASGVAAASGFFKNLGGDKDMAGIIQMITTFLKSYGTGAIKVLYDGYKQYGIPVFAEGRISWGKGKTVPFTYGTDPEKEV